MSTQQVGGPGPGVAPGPQHRARAEPLGQQRLGQDLADPGGVGLGVGVLHQVAGPPVVDEAAQPAHVGGHHRGAAGGGLQGHQPERLRPAGHQAHVGGPVVGGQQLVGAGRDEEDLVGQAERVDQAGDARHLLVAVGTARAAHDDQPGVGLVPDHRGQGGARRRPRPSAAGSGPTNRSSGPSAGQVERPPGLGAGHPGRRRRGRPRGRRSGSGTGRHRRGRRSGPPRPSRTPARCPSSG